MNYSSDSRGTIFFPIFGRFNFENENDSLKNGHDTYDVYVDEDYIGQKQLLTQNDDINDVLNFVKNQGIYNVKAHLKGDHYMIEADKEDLERVKKAIATFLANR